MGRLVQIGTIGHYKDSEDTKKRRCGQKPRKGMSQQAPSRMIGIVWPGQLSGALQTNNRNQCSPKNKQIEPERPVFDVIQVIL